MVEGPKTYFIRNNWCFIDGKTKIKLRRNWLAYKSLYTKNSLKEAWFANWIRKAISPQNAACTKRIHFRRDKESNFSTPQRQSSGSGWFSSFFLSIMLRHYQRWPIIILVGIPPKWETSSGHKFNLLYLDSKKKKKTGASTIKTTGPSVLSLYPTKYFPKFFPYEKPHEFIDGN